MKLQDEIRSAINRCSAENGSNTPDHILAEFLAGCLAAFDDASNARESWYGAHHEPGKPPRGTVGGEVPKCEKCGSSDLDDRGNCWTCLARLGDAQVDVGDTHPSTNAEDVIKQADANAQDARNREELRRLWKEDLDMLAHGDTAEKARALLAGPPSTVDEPAAKVEHDPRRSP